MATILVLNGPNLGRLGTREPDVYGSGTLDDLRATLQEDAGDDTVDLRQTDDEAQLLDAGWVRHGDIVGPATGVRFKGLRSRRAPRPHSTS